MHVAAEAAPQIKTRADVSCAPTLPSHYCAHPRNSNNHKAEAGTKITMSMTVTHVRLDLDVADLGICQRKLCDREKSEGNGQNLQRHEMAGVQAFIHQPLVLLTAA